MAATVVATALGAGAAGAEGASVAKADDPWLAFITYGEPELTVTVNGQPGTRGEILYLLLSAGADIDFFDPAGVQPPPAPCIGAGDTTIRCPLDGISSILVDLPNGDDDVSTKGVGFDPGLSDGFRLRIDGGGGDDSWIGGELGEIFDGGRGDDIGRGGDGRDRLLGGRGDDRLFGGPLRDFFLGGPGDDFARGGGGDDKGFGGPGDDDFRD